MHTIEGTLLAPKDAKFVLIAARFNELIVGQLISGAHDTLRRHGVTEEHITLVRVPGAWELPVVCQRLARSKKFDALIVLGAVIRGSTPHFDYVAGSAARGAEHASLEYDVPVAFGLLTTDTIEQAIERAGTKAGNKGADAALAALEMVNLSRELSEAGL
ncbi:MAG TPA: 6,7-dimethyl-8-ribityllumazine synthase [Polyangiaceae bacterium]|jgi:6,7-dimethyl-8-ribityllumazine synthase|nr:6,7-dimethyl-8-ribityllumazine synthase [Polyangiaceae bacterium]